MCRPRRRPLNSAFRFVVGHGGGGASIHKYFCCSKKWSLIVGRGGPWWAPMSNVIKQNGLNEIGGPGGKGRGKDCRGPAVAIFLIKVSNGQTDSSPFLLLQARLKPSSSRAELSGALNEHLTVLMVLCCPLPLRILNCILMAFHFLCAFGRGTGTRCCCQVLILFALTRVKLE